MDKKFKVRLGACLAVMVIFMAIVQASVYVHEDTHAVIDRYFGATNITKEVGFFSGVVHANITDVEDKGAYWLAQSNVETAGYLVMMMVLLFTVNWIMGIR